MRVKAGIIHHRASCHRSWSEALDLFGEHSLKVFVLGQSLHVGESAARMGGDEIRDNLLPEVLLLVDFLEFPLHCAEQPEGRLVHKVQDVVFRMLRSYLEAAAYMLGNELGEVFP